MIESSWFHFLPVLKAFLSPHYFCPKSLHTRGEPSPIKEPDAASADEKQAATILSNKWSSWRLESRYQTQEYQDTVENTTRSCLPVASSRQNKDYSIPRTEKTRSKSSRKCVFTILEATLHLQMNLLDHICHAIDELALVFSCVRCGDVGY